MSVDYPVTVNFDPPREPGRDYGTPMGTPLYAPVSGTVQTYDTGSAGWGKSMRIQNGGTIFGAGHLSKFNVASGTQVNAGDLIGFTGTSGNSSGPHVEIFFLDAGRRMFQDPANYDTAIHSWFTPNFGASGNGTSNSSSSGPATLPSDYCETFQLRIPIPTKDDFVFCFDPVIGIVAILGGGILFLGGLAVLVAIALKETSAGATAQRAVNYLPNPVGAAVKSQNARKEQKASESKSTADSAQKAVQTKAKNDKDRANVRTARARARVAEGKARGGTPTKSSGGGGTNVADSAKRKAQRGRFSDFTEEEVNWAQANQGDLQNAIKSA